MTAIVALDNWAIFVVRIHPVFRNIFSSLVFRQFVKAYIMGCQTVTATTVLTSSHLAHVLKWNKDTITGKSFSEALILASTTTNPQYDKRLFIELRVHENYKHSTFCLQIVLNVKTKNQFVYSTFSCTELVIQWTICRHIVG